MSQVNGRKDKGLAAKLLGAVIGSFVVMSVGLVVLVMVFFHNIKSAMTEVLYDTTLESYKNEIKSEVQSALSITEYYYERFQAGEMTEEAAKREALETIRIMRYGDDSSGYLWVDDRDYTLLMHPILPEQEGDNRYELTDQNGVKVLQEIMQVAAEGGYKEFYFTKADGVTVAPKVAYSKEFAPWEWVITTGVYSDDIQGIVENSEGVAFVEQIFDSSTALMIAVSAVFTIVVSILAYLLIKRLIYVV